MVKLSKKKILLFSLILINLIYFISSAYITVSNDGSHFALVSALVEDRSVVINDYVNYTWFVDLNHKDNTAYSDRPPGTAFLTVPFYTYGKIVDDFGLSGFLSSRENIKEVFVLFLPNLCGTLAFLLMFKLFMLFKFNFKESLFTSFLFSFTTFVWFESTHLYSHAISLAVVLWAVYLAVKMQEYDSKKIICISALLALASIIEIQNILFVLVFVVYLLLSKKFSLSYLSNKKIIKSLVIAAVVFMGIYSSLLIYNYVTFDELTIKSNKYNPWFTEEQSFTSSLSGNPIVGLDRLFTNLLNSEVIFDWSAGIKNDAPGLLVLSPILILSLIGFIYFFRSNKNEALFFVMLISVEVIIVAFHKTVLTRHIVTIIPYLFFPLIFVVRKSFDQIKDKKNYLLFLSIVVLSILSAVRVFYIMNSHWNRSLSDPFMFIKEIPSFILFYGSVLLVYYMCKLIFSEKSSE